MVRMSLIRRLTAAAVVMALLPFTWESAMGCAHLEASYGHAGVSEVGSRAMPGDHPPCHGGATNDDTSATSEGHDGAEAAHEGLSPETIQACHSDSSETETGCCAGGCCASPGIPLTSTIVVSVGPPTWDQPTGPLSSLVTGVPSNLFRPPIG